MFTLRGRFEPFTLTLSRTLRCPVHGKDVTAECRVAAWNNRVVDIERCSASGLVADVTCGKACLRPGRERAS